MWGTEWSKDGSPVRVEGEVTSAWAAVPAVGLTEGGWGYIVFSNIQHWPRGRARAPRVLL